MRLALSSCAVNRRRLPTRRFAAVFLFVAAAAGAAPMVSACGLEAVINGGFTVSHPRSLDVAVAVAQARRAGLLPVADQDNVTNDVRLRTLITDLQRLQSRLNAGPRVVTKDSTGPFSLVLVGPGLWSHFHNTSGGVLARYHVKGPLKDKVVVLTHAAVLKALLRGTLSVEQAVADGLLTYSGTDTGWVRQVFDASFAPKA